MPLSSGKALKHPVQMPWGLKSWRRKRILARAEIDEQSWQTVISSASYLRGLSLEEQSRLKDWVKLFLADKEFHTAHGLRLTDPMRVTIAAQACLMILNLDLDYLQGGKEIIVYPDEFVPRHEFVDEAGVVHVKRHPMAGEAWPNGPVILSWADTQRSYAADGANVVIHEFAHKIDMLNGEANGYPPLHKGMSRADWAAVFSSAYRDFCERVDADEQTLIDPYACESPAEFFAVLSEVFFEAPQILEREYQSVYAQMKAFYKQDPLGRLTALSVAI